jgi:hypothetical protein
MIRAVSTLADARYGSVFPQGKHTDSPANQTPRFCGVEVEEGIGGRLRRSDRGHPASNSSQDWPDRRTTRGGRVWIRRNILRSQ